VSRQNLQIGSSDHIVEIDEARIGKRKYQKGRTVTGQWVFGGIDKQTKDKHKTNKKNIHRTGCSKKFENFIGSHKMMNRVTFHHLF